MSSIVRWSLNTLRMLGENAGSASSIAYASVRAGSVTSSPGTD
jgi:hypothetical protein